MISRRTLLRYGLPTAAGGVVVALIGHPPPVARRVMGLPARLLGEPFRRTISSMGTFVTISVFDAPSEHARASVERAFDEIRAVDLSMSIFRPDSDVSRLNRAAGSDTVPVGASVCDVLETATRISELSSGRFDATVLPLLRLFGLRDKAPAAASNAASQDGDSPGTTNRGDPPRRQGATLRPSGRDLESCLALVDYRRLRVDRKVGRAGLELAGAEIDLGGIAKGYAIDRAVAILRAHGIRNAMLDAGGDLYAMGGPPDDDGWRIGIRDPMHPGRMAATMLLRDQAIATSGNYEQFAIVDGRRYGHLFDPAVGTPVDAVASASVVAPSAMEADALSTSAYLMGLDAGRRFVRAIDGGEAIFLTAGDDGDIEVHGAATSSPAR